MSTRRTNRALVTTRRWTAGVLLAGALTAGGVGVHLAQSYAAPTTVAVGSSTTTSSDTSSDASTSTATSSSSDSSSGSSSGFGSTGAVAGSSGSASTTTAGS